MTSSPSTVNNGTITFTSFQSPGAKDGTYTLTVKQNFNIAAQKGDDGSELAGTGNELEFSANQSFAIQGVRFKLQPNHIKSVFPPKGSLGQNGGVLPHILLTSPTLPWQRSAQGNENTPWLALLVFDKENAPKVTSVTASDLQKAQKKPIWPGLTLSPNESTTETVSVIDVPYSTLSKILPAYKDLPLLTHVRGSTKNTAGTTEHSTFSVVVANRLPRSSGQTVVHLVSLEQRFVNGIFDSEQSSGTAELRLVTLYNWSFSSVAEQFNFDQLLKNLNTTPSTIRLPAVENDTADQLLAAGKVPLPHGFRTGDKTVSWYRGPFIPFENTTDLNLPVDTSDELLQFLPDMGMMDVTYAAAWELGRLLMLQNKRASTALFSWKQQNVQQILSAKNNVVYPHLAQDGQAIEIPEALDLPQVTLDFFNELNLLQTIPFHYLVADEKLLPPESIRFFQVDNQWVECLLAGAFSIGREPGAAQPNSSAKTPAARPILSGFLLRSEVVAGFPDLEITAYAKAEETTDAISDTPGLSPIRMDRLSSNVLVCLFDNIVETVDIHLKPEVLHFGVNTITTNGKPSYNKTLRNADGSEGDFVLTSLPWSSTKGVRTINIDKLAGNIQSKLKLSSMSSAEFAMQMIEGVQNVRFVKQ